MRSDAAEKNGRQFAVPFAFQEITQTPRTIVLVWMASCGFKFKFKKTGRIDTVEFAHANFATGCNQVQQLFVNCTVLLESVCHTHTDMHGKLLHRYGKHVFYWIASLSPPHGLAFLLGRSGNQAPSRPFKAQRQHPPVFSPVSMLSITAGERSWIHSAHFVGDASLLPQWCVSEIAENRSLAMPSLRKTHL